MLPKAPSNYLAGYPVALVMKIQQLIEHGQLADELLRKYPVAHEVRTDKALYDFVTEFKNKNLRNAGQLGKVIFDNKLQVLKNALGTHTTVSRVQGGNLRSKREIRVAGIFKDMPPEFLRMIVVHELAHMKVHFHDKAFYLLCQNMEPDYPQLEFDLRVYLTYLDAGGKSLWSS